MVINGQRGRVFHSLPRKKSSSFGTSNSVSVKEISAGGMSLRFINSFSSSSLVNNLISNLKGQSGALCPGW